MRRLLASFAFALASLACADAAADPEPDYTGAVVDCVAAAGADEAALQACRGLSWRRCGDEGDDVTTHGMVMCASAEGDAWQRVMTASLNRINTARPDLTGPLKEAQDGWRRYVFAECSYRVARWGEGSGARVALASCYADLTAERAITLLVIEREID